MADIKPLDKQKKVLITGAAGFIGFHLSKRLLEQGMTVIGLDNVNDYYAVALKETRLQLLNDMPGFTFIQGDLADADTVQQTFDEHHPDIVVNLAAQAGVRYSIDNPRSYIDSNIIGFFNILEACRHFQPEHLLFASSSSGRRITSTIPSAFTRRRKSRTNSWPTRTATSTASRPQACVSLPSTVP